MNLLFPRDISPHAVLSVPIFRPIPPQFGFRLVGRFRGHQGSLQPSPAVAIPRLLDGTFLFSEHPLVVVHLTISACSIENGLSAILVKEPRKGAGETPTGTMTVTTPAERAGRIRPRYRRIRALPLPMGLPPRVNPSWRSQ